MEKGWILQAVPSSVSEIDGKSQGLERRRLEPPLEQHRRIGVRWTTLTLPVCHPALTPGIRQSWGAGKHSWALPVDSIHENFQQVYTFRSLKNCKRHSNFY